MATKWTLTIDCADPSTVARFWATALGYAQPPPPSGFATWEEWFTHYNVPEKEWGDAAYLHDPDGIGPTLSFLKVPENKTTKNRLHLDVQAGGGRDTPHEIRWPRVLQKVQELTAAGGAVLQEYDANDKPDHIVMADPEGNEFCVL